MHGRGIYSILDWTTLIFVYILQVAFKDWAGNYELELFYDGFLYGMRGDMGELVFYLYIY